VIGQRLPYDNLGQLRQRLIEVNRVFAAVDQIEPAAWGAFGQDGKMEAAPFVSPVKTFYMTDPISRASLTMAQCAEAFAPSARKGVTGTHG
jgi:NADH-quinone oxidoreductase subunit G